MTESISFKNYSNYFSSNLFGPRSNLKLFNQTDRLNRVQTTNSNLRNLSLKPKSVSSEKILMMQQKIQNESISELLQNITQEIPKKTNTQPKITPKISQEKISNLKSITITSKSSRNLSQLQSNRKRDNLPSRDLSHLYNKTNSNKFLDKFIKKITIGNNYQHSHLQVNQSKIQPQNTNKNNSSTSNVFDKIQNKFKIICLNQKQNTTTHSYYNNNNNNNIDNSNLQIQTLTNTSNHLVNPKFSVRSISTVKQHKKYLSQQQMDINQSLFTNAQSNQPIISINYQQIPHLKLKDSTTINSFRNNSFKTTSNHIKQLSNRQTDLKLQNDDFTQNHESFKKLINEKQFKRPLNYIKEIILKGFLRMKRLNIKISLLLIVKVFSQYAFEKQYSYEFILAAKLGQSQKICEYLNLNQYLVYDFDPINMTALHWAVKRGNISIVEILLKHGADPNAQDLVGRTPLYFAIINNYKAIVKYIKASPWSNIYVDYALLCSQKDPEIYILLRKSRQIFIVLKLTSLKLRDEIWEHKRLFFSNIT